jgi:hypothetical protein
MTLEVHDVVGAVGVVLIVIAYFMLQIGRLRSESLAFSASNAVGAALILFSLYFEFNASAALIEAFWLLISLYGVVRYFARRRFSAGES